MCCTQQGWQGGSSSLHLGSPGKRQSEGQRVFSLAEELSGTVASRKQISSKIVPQLTHFIVDLLICLWFFFLGGGGGGFQAYQVYIFLEDESVTVFQGRGATNAPVVLASAATEKFPGSHFFH